MDEIICEGTYQQGWNTYRCGKKGKYQREGKWYCGMHDPIRVQEKRDKRNAEWEAKWKKKEAENLLKEKEQEYNYFAGLYCKNKGLTIQDMKEPKEDKS